MQLTRELIHANLPILAEDILEFSTWQEGFVLIEPSKTAGLTEDDTFTDFKLPMRRAVAIQLAVPKDSH